MVVGSEDLTAILTSVDETRQAQGLKLGEDGVLRAALPPGERKAEDVQAFAVAARRLLAGAHAQVLLDATKVSDVEPEAFLAAIRTVESFASMVAVVVSETTPQQLAIYQNRINALLLPCRLFYDSEPAEQWLREQRDED